MRRAHYLKKNSKVELPSNMVFVDTETAGTPIDDTTERHELTIGVACHVRTRRDRGKDRIKEEWFEFTSREHFWAWVEKTQRPRSKTYVFAHNWNFDAGVLRVQEWAKCGGWECITYINDAPPFLVVFRKGSRTIALVDTLNYFQGSLASIGKSVGLPKGVMPDADASLDLWRAYNRRDVEILVRAILRMRDFVAENDLGNWQQTLASQAMTAYRHRFMDTRILIHDNQAACELERESYYGGRTECFYLGDVKDDLYYLDVNSMYPAVMAVEEFPTILQGYVQSASIKNTQNKLRNHLCTAEALVSVSEPVFPLRHGGRLVFPVGEFTAALSTPELRYGFERGYIKEIRRLAWYEKAPIFSAFVGEIYKLRRQFADAGNETFSYLAKILLNSLYGKFGQNGIKWDTVGVWPDVGDPPLYIRETPDAPIVRRRVRLGTLQELSRDGESQNSFPAISAHVTAHARMVLWRLIQQAGRENVFYCDTDSLVTNAEGYARLKDKIAAATLGGLKVEATASSATFWGAKDYRFGDVERHKGIKANAIQHGPATWQQAKFHSWGAIIGRGDPESILIETVEKTLHREYRKGTPTPSGWVKPFVAVAGQIQSG